MVMFLEAQVYEIKKNIIFQDNQSTIMITNNGRDSCTGNSRHIDILYFSVKDIVDKGEINFKYYPTYIMIADYFTKPLQGKMFKMYRDLVMGYVHINDILKAIELSSKKPVDKSKNVAVSSITKNGKISYAEICKSSENKDVKEGEGKDLLT